MTLFYIFLIYSHGISRDKPITFEKDTIIDTTIIIPENATCIIKPGVTLRFSGYHRFVVHGLLVAEGKKDKPILITGVDRIRGSTARPCWQGLEIRENADAVLRYCRVEGAFKNKVFKAKPVFDFCEFVGNHYALYCVNKAAAHIKNCRIYRNKYGIIANYASPIILDNIITENEIGVQMMLSSRLIAGRNTISRNRIDIDSEESFGENYDAMSLKHIWDLMNQLY